MGAFLFFREVNYAERRTSTNTVGLFDCKNIRFPHNVNIARANENTLAPFTGYIKEYCNLFGVDYDKLMDAPFTLLSPDSKNPYKQMYVMN